MGKAGIENRVNQLQSEQNPFSASMRLGGLHDSRVGAASSVQTGGQEDSALAVILAGGYQFPIEGDMGLRVDYSGYADFHKDYDEFNVIDQTVSVEPQLEINENLLLSLPLSYNYVLEDYKTDSDRYSASPTVTYYIAQLNQAVAINAIFANTNDKDDISADEDGKSNGLGVAYMFFFVKNFRVRLSMDYLNTKYDARLIDYMTGSTSQEHREDDVLSTSADIQYNFTPNMGVFTSYTYLHTNSNVDVYEYDRSIIEGGIALRY